MTREASRILARPQPLDVAYDRFHRVVALVCLALGVYYWVRLVGYYDLTLWRFDRMPLHWQVPAVSLAVLFPFAAVGLWLVASWGPVIWFLCVAIEFAMYGVFAEYFGSRPLILAGHVAVALAYAGFRIALYLRKRRERD